MTTTIRPQRKPFFTRPPSPPPEWITLDWDLYLKAVEQGVQRNNGAIRVGRLSRTRRDGYSEHITGALGETGAALYGGITPALAIGTLDKRQGDVGGKWQIKTTAAYNHLLLIQKDDNLKFPYVFARLHWETDVGGSKLFGKPLLTGVVELVGWIWGEEARPYWTTPQENPRFHSACFAVPCEMPLRPMPELLKLCPLH